jgi:hypothetical protein
MGELSVPKAYRQIAVAVTFLLVTVAPYLAPSAALAQAGPHAPAALPQVRDLAAALSNPVSRDDALLTMIALSRSLPHDPQATPGQWPPSEASLRDDRAWLDRLAGHYAGLPSRSTALDPAAWFIQQELGQQDILPSMQVSPLGPPYADLLAELFDRSDERLAASYLPEALFQAEFHSTVAWAQWLARAAVDPEARQLLSSLAPQWFEPWLTAESAGSPGSVAGGGLIEASVLSLQALMTAEALAQPADEARMRRLRFGLLAALPELEQGQARSARQVLCLVTAIEAMHSGRLAETVPSLLWVVADLLDMQARDPQARSRLSAVLQQFLPVLSGATARDLAEVDVHFNSSLAAIFDVVQTVQDGSSTRTVLDRLQRETADAVAQFVLQLPEMSVYFDQPVRKRIATEIDVCVSVAAVRDDNGKPLLTRKQFDACLASITKLADTLLRRAELAGDPNGPFAAEQLRREFGMLPWQRINYTLGYLHQRTPVTCAMPQRPLPNPLEWSVLANLMAWFSSQAPVYLQTPENELLVNGMRRQGLDLLRVASQQVECINESSGRFGDLIGLSIQQYADALAGLADGVRTAQAEFKAAHLRVGADIDLGGGTQQQTAYRTPGLTIGPCDPANICEMNQPLEATRALVGQFPDVYLVADQTGLGDVEICYDNMHWVERRMELVRPDDPNVANFYGHLSFDLVGRFRQGQSVSNVFGSNFISPDEYHYLVAANSQQVLDDGCPTAWVGSRIVTKRQEEGGFHIVPNRLTYLAAAHNRPSQVIAANWDRGAEWRDWFVTGIGVTELRFDPDHAIDEQLAQHLRGLFQEEQAAVYHLLLAPQGAAAAPTPVPLQERSRSLTTYKDLLRHQLALFYPAAMLDSAPIRMAMEGQGGLLDESLLHRFQDNNMAVSGIGDAGRARLEAFRTAWQSQPVAAIRGGSVAVSMAHAMARLNALQREYFVAPPAPPAAVSGDDAAAGLTPSDR